MLGLEGLCADVRLIDVLVFEYLGRISIYLRSHSTFNAAPLRHCSLATFTTSAQNSMDSIMQPRFSEGQDESKVKVELETLLKNGWQLDSGQSGIQKTYYFKTYAKEMVPILWLKT